MSDTVRTPSTLVRSSVKSRSSMTRGKRTGEKSIKLRNEPKCYECANRSHDVYVECVASTEPHENIDSGMCVQVPECLLSEANLRRNWCENAFFGNVIYKCDVCL